MAFKSVFIALAPDAEPQKHHATIETGKAKFNAFLVKTLDQAVDVCKNLNQKEGIDSVTLCPGFSHKDVAVLFDALNGKVAVSIARGDGPSNQITDPILQREFFDK